MTTEHLQAAAESNVWWAITPELILAGGALFLLVAEIILKKDQHRHIPILSVIAQVAALVGVAFTMDSIWVGETNFAGLLKHSELGQVARIFFLSSGLLVTFLAGICLPRTRMPRVEFYH